MGFSCVHTGVLFLMPNIEISTYVQKYKLHNQFSDSGPVATYTGADCMCAQEASDSAHLHTSSRFLKFQHPSDPTWAGNPRNSSVKFNVCSHQILDCPPAPFSDAPEGGHRMATDGHSCQHTAPCPALQQLPAPGKLCCWGMPSLAKVLRGLRVMHQNKTPQQPSALLSSHRPPKQ